MKPKLYTEPGNTPYAAAYVAKGSEWENPFEGSTMVRCGDIDKAYVAHYRKNKDYMAYARRELRGKDLLCTCGHINCHGKFLLYIANCDDDEYKYITDGRRALHQVWSIAYEL